MFYTGAAPNQQAIPAVDYLMSKDGGSVKRWVLAGTDYVYPRTTNKILEAYLLVQGRGQGGYHDQLHAVRSSPTGRRSSPTIKKFGSAGKKTAVVSTINGDANVPFYKELGNQGVKAEDIPVVAFSVGEEELAGHRHQAAGRPSRRLELFPVGEDTRPTRRSSRAGRPSPRTTKRVTNDPMEAHVIGFNMWIEGGEEGRHDGSATR